MKNVLVAVFVWRIKNKNKKLIFLFIELIEDYHIFSLDSYKLLHMVNRVLTII